MEYMILRDGSLKLFSPLQMMDEVLDALAVHDGVAYYWYAEAFKWSCIKEASDKHRNVQISEDDVPEIVRMAHMLR